MKKVCVYLIYWSGRRELNPRPKRWQRFALPLSYSRLLKNIIKQRFFISKSLGNQVNLEWTALILRPNICDRINQNEKTISILFSGFNKWLISSYNQQSHVHNVIKKLLNKCRPIIVSIFGSVLAAKINLNLKRVIVVFIVLMEVLDALLSRRVLLLNEKKL